MTLILAYVSQAFVAVAADHRITQGTTSVSDERTKLINFENRYLLGFTGLAELGRAKTYTAEWIARTLHERQRFDIDTLVDDLRAILAERQLPQAIKRLELLLAGFLPDGRPFVGLISNMRSDAGEVLAEARDTFSSKLHVPPGYDIQHVGQDLSDTVRTQMLKRLNNSHRGGPAPEATVSQILAGTIQASAGTYVNAVALISVIRRRRGTAGHLTP